MEFVRFGFLSIRFAVKRTGKTYLFYLITSILTRYTKVNPQKKIGEQIKHMENKRTE